MRDEGFLSPAGKRFVLVAAVLMIGGLITYYALSEEISFDFLEEIGPEETSTTSTTFDVPDVEVPEIAVPETPSGPPPSAQRQIQKAEKIFDCIERAQGDVDAISVCANQ